MFLDEFTIQAKAGRGGDGRVSFARRKYESFAGPDGGDGGKGGDVVLVGQRDIDAYNHLHTVRTKAEPGQPGGENLMIGAVGADCEIKVPLGTIAYLMPAGIERGTVTAGSEHLVICRGGKGGKGNPHYSTGGRRAPKLAGPGTEGDKSEFLLRYRIYADTFLVEPCADHPQLLLPQLIERPFAEVDWDLFERKPRWVRYTMDYRAYDIGYLCGDLDDTGELLIEHLEHLYWAQHAVINLLPLEELAEECWPHLHRQLLELPLRRLTNLVVLAGRRLFEPWQLETEGEIAQVRCEVLEPTGDSMAAFTSQLTGGIVT